MAKPVVEREVDNEGKAMEQKLKELKEQFENGEIDFKQLEREVDDTLRKTVEYTMMVRQLSRRWTGYWDADGRWIPQTYKTFFKRQAKLWSVAIVSSIVISAVVASSSHVTYDTRKKIFERYGMPVTAEGVKATLQGVSTGWDGAFRDGVLPYNFGHLWSAIF